MDFDPVVLARLQFAFTIVFHIIFPSFTIGLSAYLATLGAIWLRTGNDRYQHLMHFSTRIFSVSFAMGSYPGLCWRIGSRPTGPLLGCGGQCGRAADPGIPKRFLPRSDVSRRPALWLQTRAALALCCRLRLSQSAQPVSLLDFVGQQLDANTSWPSDEHWCRTSADWLAISLFYLSPFASFIFSTLRISRLALSCLPSVRAICWQGDTWTKVGPCCGWQSG